MKYVYCPALLTLESRVSRGRACKAQSQHKHFMKTAFPKAFAILWQLKCQYPRSSCEGFFPKNCCPPHSSLHLPNIHHPHLLRPLHHLHLLYFSTSTSTPSSSSPSSSSSSTSVCLTSITYTTYTFFRQPHLYDLPYLQQIHYVHHHLHHYTGLRTDGTDRRTLICHMIVQIPHFFLPNQIPHTIRWQASKHTDYLQPFDRSISYININTLKHLESSAFRAFTWVTDKHGQQQLESARGKGNGRCDLSVIFKQRSKP